jgi:hypothetical protein
LNLGRVGGGIVDVGRRRCPGREDGAGRGIVGDQVGLAGREVAARVVRHGVDERVFVQPREARAVAVGDGGKLDRRHVQESRQRVVHRRGIERIEGDDEPGEAIVESGAEARRDGVRHPFLHRQRRSGA